MRRTIETEQVLRQHLAANVHARRRAAGLTLKKASERGEMYWRIWRKIEAGEVNVTLRSLAQLSDALGVHSAELLLDR